MLVKTTSGTIYEFEGSRVRRLNKDPDGTLRRDGDWLNLFTPVDPIVGSSMVMILEPLGEGSFTARTTSPVVEVIND